jgi:hypothetical protein
MKLKDVNELFARVGRMASTLKEKSGSGAKWDFTFPEGDTHTYKISNVKSPETIEDNVYNLFIWIWNAKDYLKSLAKEQGIDPNTIENEINNNMNLALCGDIANRLKHGDLSRSRSNTFPKLDRVKYNIPQNAIGSITFRYHEVETNVSDPNLVNLSLSIISNDGYIIGDAFETLSKGISGIEDIFKKIV